MANSPIPSPIQDAQAQAVAADLRAAIEHMRVLSSSLYRERSAWTAALDMAAYRARAHERTPTGHALAHVLDELSVSNAALDRMMAVQDEIVRHAENIERLVERLR